MAVDFFVPGCEASVRNPSWGFPIIYFVRNVVNPALDRAVLAELSMWKVIPIDESHSLKQTTRNIQKPYDGNDVGPFFSKGPILGWLASHSSLGKDAD